MASEHLDLKLTTDEIDTIYEAGVKLRNEGVMGDLDQYIADAASQKAAEVIQTWLLLNGFDDAANALGPPLFATGLWPTEMTFEAAGIPKPEAN